MFLEHVDLPRGPDREHVHVHDRDYTLRRSEARTLTTVGAFRVVPANDLRDKADTTPLKAGFGVVMVHRNSCGLANKLLDTLRQAMRKARG